MPEIPLRLIIKMAAERHAADGLYNADGPCGCGFDDMAPGDCLSGDCRLAKSRIATEEDVDDCIEPGDTIYCPIQINPPNTTNNQPSTLSPRPNHAAIP